MAFYREAGSEEKIEEERLTDQGVAPDWQRLSK